MKQLNIKLNSGRNIDIIQKEDRCIEICGMQECHGTKEEKRTYLRGMIFGFMLSGELTQPFSRVMEDKINEIFNF